jgi:hypothetical protein
VPGDARRSVADHLLADVRPETARVQPVVATVV